MNAPRDLRGDAAPSIEGIEITGIIDVGGFATVFRGRELKHDRDVAVKVARSNRYAQERLVTFEAEGRLMAKVSDHPRIAKVFSSGTAPDGRPYIVMQFYDRGNYGARSRGVGLPEAEVLRVGVQIASAVEAAHRREIIHGDIKPDNVLIDEYGAVLTDFGIATLKDGPKTGEDFLTISYSAPELLVGSGRSTVPTDVYALSATLWALLTGEPPFVAGSQAELIRRISKGELPEPGRNDVSPGLVRALHEGLDRNPLHRPPSARLLAERLRRVEAELGYLPTPLDLPVELSDVRADVPVDTTERETRANTVLQPVPTPKPSVIPGLSAVLPDDAEPRPWSVGSPVPPRGGAESDVPSPATSAAVPAQQRSRGPLVAGAVLIVLAILAVAAVANSGGSDPPTRTPGSFDPGDPPRIPALSGVTATRVGPTEVHITWSPEGLEPGDVIRAERVGTTGDIPPHEEVKPPLIVPAPAGRTCFDVWAVADTRISARQQVCG